MVPSSAYFTGKLFKELNLSSSPDEILHAVKDLAKIELILGFSVLALCTIWYSIILSVSEILTIKTRAAYLKSILDSDCEWLDEN